MIECRLCHKPAKAHSGAFWEHFPYSSDLGRAPVEEHGTLAARRAHHRANEPYCWKCKSERPRGSVAR